MNRAPGIALICLFACTASDDPPVPSVPAPGQGAAKAGVTLSPMWYERWLFGPTLVGASATATATITAHEEVTQLEVSVTRAGYALTSGCPDRLAAGESCTLTLVFAPLGQGSYSGDHNLVVSWKTPDGPGELRTGLGGIGIVAAPAPGVFIPQAEVRMPPAVIGETSILRIPVVNSGASWATVGLVSAGNPPELSFTLDAACRNGVAPGESCTIEARYTPSAWGCSNALLRLEQWGPATFVRGCAARSEERGRARLDGVGPLIRDRDGFLFTHARGEPSGGQLHRLLADGKPDPGFGDRGHLALGADRYAEQGLRALGPGRALWFGVRRGASDLALVVDGVPGELVTLPCVLVDAAVTDVGKIGLLCGGDELAVTQRNADLSEDLAFGRAVVLSGGDEIFLEPFSLLFDAIGQRYVVSAFAQGPIHLHVRLETVGAAGESEPGFVYELPFDYDFSDRTQTLLGSDGSPFVVGVLASGPTRLLNVAKIAPGGGLDPSFGGGSVSIPLASVGSAPFVALAAEAPSQLSFLVQLLHFEQGASWDAIDCASDGQCTQVERIATSREAALPISLQDGARWLASGRPGHTTFNWTYFTASLAAVRSDGNLDPAFASDDDLTDHRPGGAAPWRLRADGRGFFYVAAHDILGQRRQPRVTRHDATGARVAGFDFTVAPRRPEPVSFWELVGSAGGEVLYGRNLDLQVAPDGSGVLAWFDGNARQVWLSAFTPDGAPDRCFGDDGQLALDFELDDVARFGGPFGVNLARLPDGSWWVSIDASRGLLRHVSSRGTADGAWLDPQVGRIGALFPSGDDLLVFGDRSVRVSPAGELSPIGGSVGPNAAVAPAPDGGYFLASPCVSRFTADGQPADGRGRPLFGDRGSLCFDGVGADAARAIVVREDGQLDVYTTSRRTRLSPDGQVIRQDGFAPELVRDALATPQGTLILGRDPARRMIFAAGP